MSSPWRDPPAVREYVCEKPKNGSSWTVYTHRKHRTGGRRIIISPQFYTTIVPNFARILHVYTTTVPTAHEFIIAIGTILNLNTSMQVVWDEHDDIAL